MESSCQKNSCEKKASKHPCYSFEAHHKYARMHLPVAPGCNINCNYCNRQFDCLHESRPGVTSELLEPEEALEKFKQVKKKIENLSVVGIAGPGDALANWEKTRKVIELIQEEDREIIFCLSTNGLLLPHLAGELLELRLRHITVTVNCLDPLIGAKIYSHVSYQGEKYKGVQGAELLINNQLQGIKMLADNGVLVKVNTVMIEGINDGHVPEIAKRVGELGAHLGNIMPLIPAQGSAMEAYPPTSMMLLNEVRQLCQGDLPQMTHCKQCRADAIGMLGNDRNAEFSSGRGKYHCEKEAV